MKTLYQARRAMSLANIRQLRMMIRENRQVISARRCIEEAQRDMAFFRRIRNNPGEQS